MEKIILRHRKTGETRTVDKAKYLTLAPDRQALYEVVAEPTTEQFAEAERLAGKGESGSSLLGSFGRGASAGITGEPPTTLMGAGAEALGAGLRDAGLAVVLGRLAGPRSAAAVPTVTGAVEGFVTTPGGMAERLPGAAIGALTANIPLPKIVERTVSRLGDIAGETIGKRFKGKAKADVDAAAGNLEKTRAEIKDPDVETGLSPAEELEVEGAQVKELETKKEKSAKVEKVDWAETGRISATAGAEGGMADLVRQVPQQAVAAIMADPRLEGRELSTITPSEMWAALKRAVQLIGDEDARVQELAIRETQK